MSEAAGAADIHKADPARRRLLLVLLPLGGAALYALSRGFGFYLDHLPTDSTGQMRASSRAVLAAITFCLYFATLMLGLLALYWRRVSGVMQAAPRYPLPQMRLFHDMRILSGADKQAQVRRLRRGAVFAGVGAAAALATALWLPGHEAQAHPALFDASLPDHRFDEPTLLKKGGPP